MSTIKAITVVNIQATNHYSIGKEINGLTIARISNDTVEYEDAIHFLYSGYTDENELVFELVNVPVDVQYE